MAQHGKHGHSYITREKSITSVIWVHDHQSVYGMNKSTSMVQVSKMCMCMCIAFLILMIN